MNLKKNSLFDFELPKYPDSKESRFYQALEMVEKKYENADSDLGGKPVGFPSDQLQPVSMDKMEQLWEDHKRHVVALAHHYGLHVQIYFEVTPELQEIFAEMRTRFGGIAVSVNLYRYGGDEDKNLPGHHFFENLDDVLMFRLVMSEYGKVTRIG